MSEKTIKYATKLLVAGLALSIGTGCEVDLTLDLENGELRLEDFTTGELDVSESDDGVDNSAPEESYTPEPRSIDKSDLVMGSDYFGTVTDPAKLFNSHADVQHLPDGVSRACELEILGPVEATVGDTVVIEWDTSGYQAEEVKISIANVDDVGMSVHFLYVDAPNTGSYEWELPEMMHHFWWGEDVIYIATNDDRDRDNNGWPDVLCSDEVEMDVTR